MAGSSARLWVRHFAFGKLMDQFFCDKPYALRLDSTRRARAGFASRFHENCCAVDATVLVRSRRTSADSGSIALNTQLHQASMTYREESEYKEYRDRSDQSIPRTAQYGLKLYREADQFGDGTDRDREIYGTVFKQIGCYDKPRTLEWITIPQRIASTGKTSFSRSCSLT